MCWGRQLRRIDASLNVLNASLRHLGTRVQDLEGKVSRILAANDWEDNAVWRIAGSLSRGYPGGWVFRVGSKVLTPALSMGTYCSGGPALWNVKNNAVEHEWDDFSSHTPEIRFFTGANWMEYINTPSGPRLFGIFFDDATIKLCEVNLTTYALTTLDSVTVGSGFTSLYIVAEMTHYAGKIYWVYSPGDATGSVTTDYYYVREYDLGTSTASAIGTYTRTGSYSGSLEASADGSYVYFRVKGTTYWDLVKMEISSGTVTSVSAGPTGGDSWRYSWRAAINGGMHVSINTDSYWYLHYDSKTWRLNSTMLNNSYLDFISVLVLDSTSYPIKILATLGTAGYYMELAEGETVSYNLLSGSFYRFPKLIDRLRPAYSYVDGRLFNTMYNGHLTGASGTRGLGTVAVPGYQEVI